MLATSYVPAFRHTVRLIESDSLATLLRQMANEVENGATIRHNPLLEGELWSAYVEKKSEENPFFGG